MDKYLHRINFAEETDSRVQVCKPEETVVVNLN